MKHLYLLRGIPGSGKTTLAEQLAPWANFSADQWFDAFNAGVFDPKHIGDAHLWCRQRCQAEMEMSRQDEEGGTNHSIAIHNTFTQLWEMNDYRKLAERFDYQVTVLILDQNHGSVHGVPTEKVAQMAKRFEFNGLPLGV